MASARVIAEAVPSHVRPVCGASQYERIEALLVAMELLRTEDVGRSVPLRRSRDPSKHAMSLHADDFFRSTGLGRHRAEAVQVTQRLLLNIPNAPTSQEAPRACQYPMLTRLRTLLKNPKLCEDTQYVINALGDTGAAPSPEAMHETWQRFLDTGSKNPGYLGDIMELLVLLHRAKEVFLPIQGDRSNEQRYKTWHREPPDGWNGVDDSVHSLEYVWFHRLSAHLHVRLLRGFSSAAYTRANYLSTAKWVLELARRTPSAREWPS